jgi:dihydrofolate reductase
MGKVVVDLSMSLDGFVAQPDDDAGPLHEWYFTGDTTSRHNKEFRLSEPSREVFDQVFETMGAVIVGRRTYDFTDGWGGSPPIPGAYFVLTHRPPDPPPRAAPASPS